MIAKDKGSPSLQSSAKVKIVITDVNDNKPIFEKSSYSVSIPENTNINTTILDIRATDQDTGNNGKVMYKISQGNTSMFHIEKNTGDLMTSLNLDRETTSNYQLTIEAYDSGSPSLSKTVVVIITILDVNDNNPIIDESSVIRNINESSPVGSEVGHIKASDKDDGENGKIIFKIKDTFEGTYFNINNVNGKVFLAKKLDRESKAVYFVTIIVEDKGTPMLRTERTYTVQVLDDNDNKPIFENSLYTG